MRIGTGSDDAAVAANRDLRGACPDAGRGSEIGDWAGKDEGRRDGGAAERPIVGSADPTYLASWLREKLIKIGAKVVRHAKYVTFQMAEVAVPRELFAAILERIRRFGVPPPLA